MGLFVDSAVLDEVKQAVELGFLMGVTTNPTLMARADKPARVVIKSICDVSPGPVFYQLTATTRKDQVREGRDFYALCPEKVVLKIPATTANMSLLAELAPDMPCAATAVYAAHQAYVACCAGARYLIPYVNRATRLLGDGLKLVEEVGQMIDAQDDMVDVLAASIKSPEEAAKAIVAGADHLTLPLDVLLAMGNHQLSDAAIAEFAAAAR